MARKLFGGLKAIATRTYFEPKLVWKHGMLTDVSPRPGCSYVKAAKGEGHAYSWPPVGRGRGESLTSARRIQAKLRAYDALQLRREGYTFEAIARKLGFKNKSGAWHAIRRLYDRHDYDRYASKLY